MTSGINHQIRLAGRPVGLPKRSDWQFTEAPIPEPRDGEVLTRVLYLSLDPAMRGWMNEGKSYIAPVGIGDVMRAGAVGKVVASRRHRRCLRRLRRGRRNGRPDRQDQGLPRGRDRWRRREVPLHRR